MNVSYRQVNAVALHERVPRIYNMLKATGFLKSVFVNTLSYNTDVGISNARTICT